MAPPLETGVYNIRASGIWQADPEGVPARPFGPNRPTIGPASFQPGGINLTTYPQISGASAAAWRPPASS